MDDKKDSKRSDCSSNNNSLIPNCISQIDIEQAMSVENINKTFWQYMETSTTEVIDTALLLGKNYMLNKANLKSLASDLSHMTVHSTPDVYPTAASILDMVLDRGLHGNTKECRTTLRLMLELFKKTSFRTIKYHIFVILRQTLSWEIPSQKTLLIDMSKKSGTEKFYFLQNIIPKFEAAFRRLQKAIFMAGVFYMTDFSNGHNTISQLINELSNSPMTIHVFIVVTGIIIVVKEEENRWEVDRCSSQWPPPPFKFDEGVKEKLDLKFKEFIVNYGDQLPYELHDYLNERFAQAFSQASSSKKEKNKDFNGSIHVKGDKAEKIMLERLYSKLYQQMEMYQGSSNNPSPSSPSVSSTTEGPPNWVKDIEEISTLLRYGLTKRLPKEFMQKQINISEKETSEENIEI